MRERYVHQVFQWEQWPVTFQLISVLFQYLLIWGFNSGWVSDLGGLILVGCSGVNSDAVRLHLNDNLLSPNPSEPIWNIRLEHHNLLMVPCVHTKIQGSKQPEYICIVRERICAVSGIVGDEGWLEVERPAWFYGIWESCLWENLVRSVTVVVDQVSYMIVHIWRNMIHPRWCSGPATYWYPIVEQRSKRRRSTYRPLWV
jgi:hypothetical protein